MLSHAAYKVGSVLVAGAATVHELKSSVATEGVHDDKVDTWLLQALLELIDCGFVTFLYEPMYGDLPPVIPECMTVTEFHSLWCHCFEHGVCGVPESSRTIFVESTDNLVSELAKEEYSAY